MADLARAARVAIVSRLRATTEVTALLPAVRIYGPEAPALPDWPWGYVASPIETPFRASCINGSRLSVVVHAFAKGPGDDACSAIASAVKAALDGVTITLVSAQATIDWEQTQIVRDSAEASAYHAIIRLAVDVAA